MRSYAIAAPALSALLVVACVGDPVAASGPEADASSDAALGDGATSDVANVDGSACDSPKKSCTKGAATVCTDTSSDDQNCGDCNIACAAGATCKTSKCACTEATKTYCVKSAVGSCVDTQNDPNNCGACGNQCFDGKCSGGACSKIVFVTSTTTYANITISGDALVDADKTCNILANAAGLPAPTWPG